MKEADTHAGGPGDRELWPEGGKSHLLVVMVADCHEKLSWGC